MLAHERFIEQHSSGVELYDDNSGTSLAIKGTNYIVVAADTRNSGEYHINTRKATKIFVIDKRLILTTTGFYADARSVLSKLIFAVEDYQFKFNKPMDVSQAAAILHIILYSHRFFPKYAYCTLTGFSNTGEPKLFSYDPVGSYQENPCECHGTGTKMLQPFLDSWISRKNWHCEEGKAYAPAEEELVKLVKDVFNSAAEKDVKTGDHLEVYVIRQNNEIIREEFPLRSD
ncbi:20S proteasome subunit beta 6 [Nematocida sp. AWRm77]|nr:20S proteasome subunit beta 6 [Nematocida sp. AWRm77]